MAMLVTDPFLEERLKLQRKEWGADRYDEVWEGVYVMSPIPNVEHQDIVASFTAIFKEIIGWSGLGVVLPGVNLTEREDDWEFDYRVPDVAVALKGGQVEDRDTHWRGAADLLVEITSPGDRTRQKIPYYGRLGVRELWVVDRSTWTLELYRWRNGGLQLAGQSSLETPNVLQSEVVPLRLRLVPGTNRPEHRSHTRGKRPKLAGVAAGPLPRLVPQVRRQPPLGFGELHPLAPRVVFDLVAGHPVHGRSSGTADGRSTSRRSRRPGPWPWSP